MTFLRRHTRVLLLAGSCAALGAGAGAIANAGAASPSQTAAVSAQTRHARLHPGARALLAGAVHGDVVVKTSSGFVNVTFDRGFIESLSGQQLTLREGTTAATYKTVTVTLPSNAQVRLDRMQASLSQLKAGQHVIVAHGPTWTRVIARTVR